MSEFGREFPGANAQTELTNVGSTEAPPAYDADYANASLSGGDELSEVPIIPPDEVEQAHVEATPASGSHDANPDRPTDESPHDGRDGGNRDIVGPGDGDGIPAYVFNPGFDRVILTRLGRQLWCRVSKHWIEIGDNVSGSGNPADNAYHFVAWLNTHDGTNSLGLSIRSKMGDVRHPDIHAQPLIDKTIEYFEGGLPPGERIESMSGNWSSGYKADNWKQYHERLAEMEPGPYLPEQKASAATSTWTGHVASKHGFTVVDGNEIEELNGGSHVLVHFRRPDGSNSVSEPTEKAAS